MVSDRIRYPEANKAAANRKIVRPDTYKYKRDDDAEVSTYGDLPSTYSLLIINTLNTLIQSLKKQSEL